MYVHIDYILNLADFSQTITIFYRCCIQCLHLVTTAEFDLNMASSVSEYSIQSSVSINNSLVSIFHISLGYLGKLSTQLINCNRLLANSIHHLTLNNTWGCFTSTSNYTTPSLLDELSLLSSQTLSSLDLNNTQHLHTQHFTCTSTWHYDYSPCYHHSPHTACIQYWRHDGFQYHPVLWQWSWWWGPQDFLNKVECGFSGKTLLEKDKICALKL